MIFGIELSDSEIYILLGLLIFVGLIVFVWLMFNFSDLYSFLDSIGLDFALSDYTSALD